MGKMDQLKEREAKKDNKQMRNKMEGKQEAEGGGADKSKTMIYSVTK